MGYSSFLAKLDRLRANNCNELPTPELAVLARSVARLRREGLAERCLQVGETSPDFEFIDHSDTPQRFYDIVSRGPVVLNFFRGFWCQYCQTEIEAYEQIQPELAELGATFFAVSPQKPEAVTRKPPNYEVIFDRDNTIARQFGIVYELGEQERALLTSWGLALDRINDTHRWELPLPATFIVCPDRRIGYEFVDVDFRARCCPEQLLEALKTFCDC